MGDFLVTCTVVTCTGHEDTKIFNDEHFFDLFHFLIIQGTFALSSNEPGFLSLEAFPVIDTELGSSLSFCSICGSPNGALEQKCTDCNLYKHKLSNTLSLIKA